LRGEIGDGLSARYPGKDRGRLAAPYSSLWRITAAGLFSGVIVVAVVLRLPADRSAIALQSELLLGATAVLTAAAGATWMLRYSISGVIQDLFAGLAQFSLTIAQVGLLQIDAGEDPIFGDTLATATYMAGQLSAIAFTTLRLTPPAVKPHPVRAALAVLAGSVLTTVALVLVDPWHDALTAFALPTPDGAILLALVVGLGWFAVIAVAVYPLHRKKAALASPTLLVVLGNGSAVLAPAIAAMTGGDPGQSRWVLAAGTALCALVISDAALQRILRGQHDRLVATEVDRVLADQVHEAERAARSELDHDLAAALLAVEGAARALERREAQGGFADDSALASAMASELARLQQLLGGVSEDGRDRSFSLSAAVLPVITCDLARGVDIRADIPSDLVAVGSPRATAEVVRNLLDNAYHHAPGAPVRISAGRDGDRVFLRVQDEGPGVPVGDRHRIFGRGERGMDAVGGGSGLGLYAAARMMAHQGGDLVLEHTPGTSFSLHLPASVEVRADG
jgi:signal transduction histidine kinase